MAGAFESASSTSSSASRFPRSASEDCSGTRAVVEDCEQRGRVRVLGAVNMVLLEGCPPIPRLS